MEEEPPQLANTMAELVRVYVYVATNTLTLCCPGCQSSPAISPLSRPMDRQQITFESSETEPPKNHRTHLPRWPTSDFLFETRKEKHKLVRNQINLEGIVQNSNES